MMNLDFTVSEYATHCGIGHSAAKAILYQMAQDGMAETLPPRPGHRMNVFRLRESEFKYQDPFGLIKRKVKPSDPNAWMRGAFVSAEDTN